MAKYQKHDLDGLLKIYNDEWELYDYKEDPSVAERIESMKRILRALVNHSGMSYTAVLDDGCIFTLTIPTGLVELDSLSKALLAEVLKQSDELGIENKITGTVLTIIISATVTLYDCKML